MEQQYPKVGIGVIIRQSGKVLIGKRRSNHGNGYRGFPGGHLEFGESIEECAIREVKEEVGITIKNITIGPITNDIFQENNTHYITIFVICDIDTGLIQNLEPEKCEEWLWCSRDMLPNNLFLPITNLLQQKYNPFI